MAQFIPNIGLTGLYTLNAPFNTVLVANVAYTCVAIRKLSDIVASGGDPMHDIYEPANLTQAQYEQDVKDDVCIVSLQAGGYGLVQVPSSYIAGHPDIGGIRYTNLALAIKLGAIPDSLDLSVIRQKITDDVLQLLGVQATTHVMAISLPTLLTNDQANTVEAARQAKIGTVNTDYTQLVATQNQLASAQQKIQELEDYIKAHPPA